ncbi:MULTISPECIES: hypothetical protein [Xanthomonas]|uniref:Helix-turn-helix domain-containing protein n=1 Tax=Xanthomonas nasturtii TaxID=1843581 RepID=A0ABT0LU11_9XANT|nr:MULTISPECIES: hypothetical protein [Xanthomonas]MCL1552830.1 hypothetical protein [Xanthomonas nasturtii]MCL1556988.1 hypothetical protein [Xanthomonas nasturtii]MCL1561591.1 hypothetical protein [Xanthomonas nasturtii]NIK34441.1 hypothetical protein [Xanthomonas arboricola]
MPDEYRKPIAANKRAKFKGRSKGAPFLAIEHRIADSEEFGRLSGNAVKLLLELARQYRPGKNGDLSIPWSLLRSRGWSSTHTVQKAKQELLESGWIIETRKGGNHVCSLFAISYYPVDESDKHLEPGSALPSNLWRQKQNPQSP